MSASPLWSPLAASALLHAAGLAGVSLLVSPLRPPAVLDLVAVELVSPPLAPVPPPPPPIAKPRPAAKLVPPKLVTVPEASMAPPAVAERTEPDPPMIEPAPPSPAPSPAPEVPAGNAGAPPRAEPPAGPTPVEGGGMRAETFVRGDFELISGSGAGGRSGRGLAASGHGDEVGGAATTPPDRLTSFARPRGGYQTRPAYPETARRAGVEGITVLKFEVLATGRVGAVVVERSADFPDLDRAAVDAVKTWRFEPARRGSQPVAVWVTLPVRFELR